MAKPKVIESLKKFNELTGEGTSFFCLDVETTGFSSSKDKITNFGCIRLRVAGDGEFEELDRMNILINPGMPIPEEVQQLTGITDEMVASARKYPEAYELIKRYIGNSPIVSGYNSDFDIRFIRAMYEENGDTFEPACHVDVLKMVKEKVSGTENHKLITITQHLELDDGLDFHKALDDVKATVRVFNAVRKLYTEDDYNGYTKVIASHDEPFKAIALNRWKKFSLDRIYISNNWNESVYFDVKTSAWECAGIPEAEVKSQAYELAGVSTEEELVSKIA